MLKLQIQPSTNTKQDFPLHFTWISGAPSWWNQVPVRLWSWAGGPRWNFSDPRVYGVTVRGGGNVSAIKQVEKNTDKEIKGQTPKVNMMQKVFIA